MMITETMENMIRKSFSQKIVVIPDGADMEIFTPGVNANDIKRKYGIGNEPVRGLFLLHCQIVGRGLSATKNCIMYNFATLGCPVSSLHNVI